jgi:hypothetical protein
MNGVELSFSDAALPTLKNFITDQRPATDGR